MTRPPRRTSRRLLPVGLVLIGVWLLAGCIYVPWPKSVEREGAIDYAQVVGPAGSDKPVQPGRVTKDKVIGFLGRPERESADGRSIGYRVRYKAGSWVIPLCLTAQRARSDLAVRLDFDAAGVLKGYDTIDAITSPEIMYVGPEPYPAGKVRAFLDQIGPPPQPRLDPPAPRSQPAKSPSTDPTVPDGQRYETK